MSNGLASWETVGDPSLRVWINARRVGSERAANVCSMALFVLRTSLSAGGGKYSGQCLSINARSGAGEAGGSRRIAYDVFHPGVSTHDGSPATTACAAH